MHVSSAISSVCIFVVICAISVDGKKYNIPSNKECGYSTERPNSLIIGGISVENISRWPWMAAIYEDGYLFCGGTLITDRHILSAAHCFTSRSDPRVKHKEYTVRMGVTNTSDLSQSTLQERKISKIIVHPNYYNNLGYDIAVLKLSKSVQIKKESVSVVCLPKEYPNDIPQEEYHFNDGVVTGWGSVNNKKQRREIPLLQALKVKYNFSKHCKRKNLCKKKMAPTELCAGGPKDKDSCTGDSGGPLVRMMNPKQWKIIGIVARGCNIKKCGKGGIYTRVGSHISFIKNSINE